MTGEQAVKSIAAALRQDAFNHRDLQAIDGRQANGMSVMFMGASTGCNTVYGSTPPSNPHAYPWMNSLFQDGATISWLLGESVILNHAHRSVVPERLANAPIEGRDDVMSEAALFRLAHLDDAQMSEQEIRELPKVWVIGGDGALGDIGFQNVSKVILQNRPNIKILMLDMQVYSTPAGRIPTPPPCWEGTHEPVRRRLAGQADRKEKRGRGLHQRARLALCRPGLDGQRRQALQGHARRLGISRHSFLGLHHLPARHSVADNVSAEQAKLVRDSLGMPSSFSIPAAAKPRKKPSTSRAIPLPPATGGAPNTPPPARNITSPSPIGR